MSNLFAVTIEASYGVWSWVILGIVLFVSLVWLVSVWRMPNINDQIRKYNEQLRKENNERR